MNQTHAEQQTQSRERMDHELGVAAHVGPHDAQSPARHEDPIRFSEADIAREAYAVYLAAGRPDGQDLDHWLEAERRLNAAR